MSPPTLSDDFLRALEEHRAVAVLRTDRAEAVAPAMDAAVRGGFRIIEFTLNTPGAWGQIEAFADRDDLIVGAGTVLSEADAERALDVGASFLVSPVVDEAVIQVALRRDAAILPGTHTPTEMFNAHRAGAPLVKLFPAPSTGPAYVKACLGPMPFLRIVPTSGVTAENSRDFLDAGAFALGFVAPLFDPLDLAEARFDRVEERARDLLDGLRS